MQRMNPKLRMIAIVLWLAVIPAAAQKAAINAVGAISMTVADMDRSVNFYSQVLSFATVADSSSQAGNVSARVVRMRLGDEAIELVQFSSVGRAIPADSRSNDHWFQHIAIIVSDMDRAYQRVQKNRVQELSAGPQRLPDWNRNAAGIRAFYFADPDGHPLEILQFPTGKGAQKWHRTDRLFLGIDHTAIVVADTEKSLHFYRDLLGFAVAGNSDNYGPEQEKLNHVPGAHLRITTLRTAAGPGIELLEYLAPRTGRDLPFTPHFSDLVHRHTVLLTSDVDELRHRISIPRDATLMPVANASVDAAGFFVHDPDGHELFIHSK